MAEFKQYRRTQIAEMRPFEPGEILYDVSISISDKQNGSPKEGDMIARNPKNHKDVWLVAEQYFKDNFEELTKIHTTTFEYLKPTDEQVAAMSEVRMAFHQFSKDIETRIPDGSDKTYLMRKLREVAMWANIAITRNPDGSPRT